METTLQQLPSLSAKQLLHAVKYYRAEVGEKTLSKVSLRYIQEVKSRPKPLKTEPQSGISTSDPSKPPSTPAESKDTNGNTKSAPKPPASPQPPSTPLQDDDNDMPERNLMNPALLLPFHLPTSTDMLVSYGAGFGGMNKERERRYIPSVPPEFLAKLNPDGANHVSSVYDGARFSDSS